MLRGTKDEREKLVAPFPNLSLGLSCQCFDQLYLKVIVLNIQCGNKPRLKVLVTFLVEFVMSI